MQQQDLYSTQEFMRLHPLKQQIIKEVVKSSENTSVEAMIPKIMSINNELKRRNLSFTKSESRLMIKLLSKDMSAADRSKIDMIMSMM